MFSALTSRPSPSFTSSIHSFSDLSPFFVTLLHNLPSLPNFCSSLRFRFLIFSFASPSSSSSTFSFAPYSPFSHSHHVLISTVLVLSHLFVTFFLSITPRLFSVSPLPNSFIPFPSRFHLKIFLFPTQFLPFQNFPFHRLSLYSSCLSVFFFLCHINFYIFFSFSTVRTPPTYPLEFG